MLNVPNMMGRWRRNGAAISLAISLLGLTLPALAQSSRVAEVAMYEGADRETRLLEGTKREGELSVYSSMPVEDNTAVIGAFEKKYGIKVKVWRGSSEDIVRRTGNGWRNTSTSSPRPTTRTSSRKRRCRNPGATC